MTDTMTEQQQNALAKVRAYVAKDGDIEVSVTGPHHFNGKLARRGPYIALNTTDAEGEPNREWRIFEDGYITWVT